MSTVVIRRVSHGLMAFTRAVALLIYGCGRRLRLCAAIASKRPTGSRSPGLALQGVRGTLGSVNMWPVLRRR